MKISRIYITGFMGSGKSTIGKKLAEKIKFKFIDTDNEIERRFGKEIRDIFAQEGEAWFRNREEEMLTNLAREKEPLIISLGGGALMSEKNQALVSSTGMLIYIKSSPEIIYQRIKHSTRRPLLRGEEIKKDRQQYLTRIQTLLSEREAGYNSADLIFDRDAYDADKCADLLVDLIKSKAE